MYGGIILQQGKVVDVIEQPDDGKTLRIEAPEIVARLQPGSSINVGGVCLTAHDIDETSFLVDVMPQTLKLTTIDGWRVGEVVNLEPSLRCGDELGGHFVYGHVDGLAEVVDIQDDGNALLVFLRLPDELMNYIAPQGSVALDGVSLTVADVQDDVFVVSLIPETIMRTTWKNRQIGDRVNFEADMLIKYLERLHL